MAALPGQVTLFPHQEKAVRELGNGKVLWGDVGTGKTLTAMAYYHLNEAPKDVYVITTAKKRDSLDWQADAAKFSVSTHDDTGTAKLTVDSWNNIAKYTEVKDAFFLFDEQRLVGTGAWVKSFYKIARNNRWLLLTATPGDTWLDYAPIFIANGWYKNITEFRRDHVVYTYSQKFPKVDRYIAVNRLVKQRNAVLVEMPYLRHTVRHVSNVEVDYDRDLFDLVVKKRWHPYEERPIRDVAELFLVMRKVVNSDESRPETVKQLLQKHPKLIVFYNFDYELEALRALAGESDTWTPPYSTDSNEENKALVGPLSTGRASTTSELTDGRTSRNELSSSFAMAEWNGHKHEPIPTTDSWLYLVQYTAGAEGWNCVETDAVCFFSLNYSYKITHQAMGRIDRLNTPYTDLYYYRLVSKSMIDKAVAKALGGKKSFNESAYSADTRLKFPRESVKNGQLAA